MNDFILKLAVPLLQGLLNSISPVLIKELGEFADNFWLKAEETENPFDNIIAGFLLAILNRKTPKIAE